MVKAKVCGDDKMIEGYIIGIFPRDDVLIDIWKKWERKLVLKEDFKETLDRSIEKIIDIQLNAKLSYIHDPQIDWQDMFRPFTYLNNLTAGPLTRFFENNILYRKPVIKDFVKYRNGLIADFTHEDKMVRGKTWLLSLPGPYTFFMLSDHYNNDIAEKSIVNILSKASEEAVSLGYGIIVFHEPAIAYYNDVDWNLIRRFYRFFLDTGFEYRIHLYFGDIVPKIGGIIDIAPYGFSIDTSYTLLDNISYIPTDNIILGIIDSQNTLMEDPDQIYLTTKKFINKFRVKNISLTPNTDLGYLPFEIAKSKVMLLSNILEKVGR